MTTSARRQPLDDKEERILSYAQLINASASSLTRIANRQRAIEREQKQVALITKNTDGYHWCVDGLKMQVWNNQGWSWHAEPILYPGESCNIGSTVEYRIQVQNPQGKSGERDFYISPDSRIPLRLLPDRNRLLYAFLVRINYRCNHTWPMIIDDAN
jgi:hypothetical protein